MLKRLINVLRGSVRLEVTGAFPERLLADNIPAAGRKSVILRSI